MPLSPPFNAKASTALADQSDDPCGRLSSTERLPAAGRRQVFVCHVPSARLRSCEAMVPIVPGNERYTLLTDASLEAAECV